jgi:DNA mismatch repair ATPase MutS
VCVRSGLIPETTRTRAGEEFPDYSETLGYFCEAFDWTVAKERKVNAISHCRSSSKTAFMRKKGLMFTFGVMVQQITPNPGVDLGYDEVRDNIAELERQLEEYLDEQRDRFGVTMHYTTSEKKDYLIEVPVNEADTVRARADGLLLRGAHFLNVMYICR